MTRSSILRQALPLGVLMILVASCGPRMKPVEYEEPPKDLSSSGDADADSSSSSSSSSASSSSGSSGDTSADQGGKSAGLGSCKEKKCGDACTECAPGDESCAEVLLAKQCNLEGNCVPAPVECSVAKKSKDKAKTSK